MICLALGPGWIMSHSFNAVYYSHPLQSFNGDSINELKGYVCTNITQLNVDKLLVIFFTRDQLWPPGIVVAPVYMRVHPVVRPCQRACPCDNYSFVQARITKFDQRYKRPWLRSLLFCGMVGLELQGQIELKSQNLSQFELFYAITPNKLKWRTPNLDQNAC